MICGINVQTGKVVWESSGAGPVAALTWSKDGRRVILRRSDKSTHEVDSATGRKRGARFSTP
jgi:hypothetical protein